jgi:pimeloyl-ACP methyl ester carboxylesterase
MAWHSSRKLKLTLAALVALAIPARIAWRAYRDERACFIPVRHEPRVSLEEFAIPGLRDVSFTTPSHARISGVFAPPQNGATIVLTHGSNGERSDLLAEARLLSRAGFGILAFDWPGHGLSEGSIDWGSSQRAALVSALDWLATQPDVNAARLGAYGFSMGGYITAQVAAHDARLRAVALSSTPSDPLDHLRWEYRHLAFLRRWPARLALWVSGMKTDEQVPERVIGGVSPRPLLLVRGSDDELVPGWMTERLYTAAREPKQLLVVPKAGHGGFADADPEGYPKQLVQFFSVLLR